jgi:hypothetical protein
MKENKGIREQIEDAFKNNEFVPMEDSITQEQFDNFLDDLKKDLPDGAEIFTVDRGWEKINK